jgi:hypothetical protein
MIIFCLTKRFRSGIINKNIEISDAVKPVTIKDLLMLILKIKSLKKTDKIIGIIIHSIINKK